MRLPRWVAAAVVATAVAACSGANPDAPRPSASATPAATVVDVGEFAGDYAYELRGGETMVGDARLEVPLGDTIDLLVTSDIDDVVLVRAFEIEQRVFAGEPTPVSVTVTRPGTFMVETATGILLAELVVE